MQLETAPCFWACRPCLLPVPPSAACSAAFACHVQASLMRVVIFCSCRRPAAPLAHHLRQYLFHVQQTPLCHDAADTRRAIPAGPPVHHFDLYRIESGRGLGRLEMDASLEQAVCLIEWSDRLPQAPTERLDLFFTLLNTAYQVSVWRDWSGTDNVWHAAQKQWDPVIIWPVMSVATVADAAGLCPADKQGRPVSSLEGGLACSSPFMTQPMRVSASPARLRKSY